VKWTLKESDPHHDDHHDHPDHGTEVVAAYQHELHGKGAVEAKA
jgi:hypothetical protein